MVFLSGMGPMLETENCLLRFIFWVNIAIILKMFKYKGNIRIVGQLWLSFPVLRSLSLRDPRSLLPCLQVAELQPLPQLLLVAAVVPLPKPPRRRRRKNPLRSQMTTWDSASSIRLPSCEVDETKRRWARCHLMSCRVYVWTTINKEVLLLNMLCVLNAFLKSLWRFLCTTFGSTQLFTCLPRRFCPRDP